MAKINKVSDRTFLYTLAALIALVAIGVASIAHADDRKERDRDSFRPLKSFFSFKFNDGVHGSSTVRIDNDRVNIHGAKVTATSNNGFTATSGTPIVTFNVETDADTKFNVKGDGKGSLSDITAGDIVNFRGLVLSGTTTSTLTIEASHVEDKTRDGSTSKAQAVAGTVSSVSVTGNTLVVVGKNGTTTVSVSGSTQFSGGVDNLSDINTGAHVRATGAFNSDNVFAATKVAVNGGFTSDAALKLIARLEAFIEKLKIRFSL